MITQLIRQLLGYDESVQITWLDWFLRTATEWYTLAGIVAVAAVYSLVVYRHEKALSRVRRVLLGVVRAVVLCIVIVLLFEPAVAAEMRVKLPRTMLVLLDVSASMNDQDPRRSVADVHEAAVGTGAMPYGSDPAQMSEEVRQKSSTISRIDLAHGLLDKASVSLLPELSRNHSLRCFTFGEQLYPPKGTGEQATDAFRNAAAADKVTRLGDAIEAAAARFSGQSVAGMVVITDGASNGGAEPLEAARRMKENGIPLYTIGMGLANPPDVRIGNVIVAEHVFPRDRVPVRVELAQSGFVNQTVDLSVRLDGQQIASRKIVLKDRPSYEEIAFVPQDQAGKVKLEVSVAPLAGETTAENNTITRELNVIDKKIKVLYVEGKPRWEFRYLKRVLERDYRLDVKFLMTQGDPELAKNSQQYLLDFPQDAKAFDYDLVILGDVPASYFTRDQLARMEQLVKERAGSFLMIAGEAAAPQSYVGTPVADMLPVRARAEDPREVDDALTPVITPAGNLSAVTSLESPDEKNLLRWQNVHHMFKLPVLDGPKPGATVLAEVPRAAADGVAYPLIAWQRYQTGKTMFVGTDQLWRLRFKTGAKYHARFWGQAIQFLTLSRLLGEDKRVRIELSSPSRGAGAGYMKGERIEIVANVLSDAYEPVKASEYMLTVEGAGTRRELVLKPSGDMPGLYQGYFIADSAGKFRLKAPAADEAASNSPELEVKDVSLEGMEPAMQEALLRQMAAVSGGQYFAVRDVGNLLKLVNAEQRTVLERKERELWNLPLVLGVLVVLLGAEWFLRRKWDLI
jgi:hypothetical protein